MTTLKDYAMAAQVEPEAVSIDNLNQMEFSADLIELRDVEKDRSSHNGNCNGNGACS